MDQLVNMDKESLLELVLDKDKRIQDLERLVENQRRLRMQDASQFEEKAAKIKEWVTNKLEVLANQNKQLRAQNKKQKETVESLSMKLASTMSPITTPRKKGSTINNPEHVQFIDQSTSPVDVLDVNSSLITRKPQLKKSFQTISSSSDDVNRINLQIKEEPATYQKDHDRVHKLKEKPRAVNLAKGLDYPSRGSLIPQDDFSDIVRRESPVYDSVTIELISGKKIQDKNLTSVDDTKTTESPPTPPLHQSDKWELELYSLADQTFNTIIRQQSDEKQQSARIDSCSISDKENSTSWRKSSSSSKNDLISLVKPSFTTIDGDAVVENFEFNETEPEERSQTESLNCHVINHDQAIQSSLRSIKSRKDSFDSCENIEKQMTPNLFDSPMRTRTGKDNILRTQSVRRNPAPEKLFDFISADLVKRGYLVKPGALKNHSRWFVLKNFHLYSYKCESDEAAKSTPNMKIKLEPSCSVSLINQSSESSFSFKISNSEKTFQLTADNASSRDEWVRILTVAINMSDIEPNTLMKNNATYEGIMSVTCHGHTKRYYATLINHIIFFLKSLTDPTPMNYLSVKSAKIREITDNFDYDFEEQEVLKQKSSFQDCSLAIYPKYSMTLDPVYITLGTQQEIDKWFYFLSIESGIDQFYGTQYERTLTKLMINNSMKTGRNMTCPMVNSSGCLLKERSVMLYSDRPMTQPLTSLPNETLKAEAIELFKAILLFTQVPLEPVAIDYHVCLLQNCLGRFLKYPELRNEFYAQLVKQCTYILHQCNSRKLSSSGGSSSSSGYSPVNQRSSCSSLTPSSSDCQFVTDLELLESIAHHKREKIESDLTLSQLNSSKERTDDSVDDLNPPSRGEVLQTMQILAVAVSLNLPRGRTRWWLIDYLRRFANPNNDVGKYALYTLMAIDRTTRNGTRDNVPSRMEIMSILLRNPYDHSKPHSLPVSFPDASYLVVEADGSTTVDEFMCSMTKDINIRHSLISDFYLFADDPSGSKELHILEPQRKVLDIVGWWEQTFRRNNSGRYQNTRAIKLMCKKRLILKMESDETQQERLLIVHQINQEVVSRTIPLKEELAMELAAIMAQLTFGNIEKNRDTKLVERLLEKIRTNFYPTTSSLTEKDLSSTIDYIDSQLVIRWKRLNGKSATDCVRVYLNCIRRLKLGE